MKVTERSINRLKQYPSNSNTHPAEQIGLIANSINEFGFTNPVLIDKNDMIIAGHGRVEAAISLGWTKVPCIRLEHLTPEQVRAYVIADNQIPRGSVINTDILANEIKDLQDLDYDLDVLGFDDSDMEKIKDQIDQNALNAKYSEKDADQVPETQENQFNVTTGDIWILGRHRLMCGDSTDKNNTDRLLAGEKPDMVFTDPPYGIEIVGGGKKFGTVGGVKIVPSNKYKIIEGDQSTDVAIKAVKLTSEYANRIFWGANYYAHALPQTSGWLVWDKEMTGNFGRGELAWTSSNKPLKIFKHTWNGLIKESEKKDKRVHPTQKPIALAVWCFENYGNPKTIIDLFLGSGSTLIACEKTGRQCFGMEIDPHYCSVIINRWQVFTGKKAVKISNKSDKT